MKHGETLMNPMSFKEYYEIVCFIQENHPFGPRKKEDYKHMWIKYIDCNYDTRTGSVFSIRLRGMIPDLRFSTNSMAGISKVPYNSLYDCVMAFLTYEYTDISKYFLIKK